MTDYEAQLASFEKTHKQSSKDLINMFISDQEDYECDELAKKVSEDPFYTYVMFVTDYGNSRFFVDFPHIFRAFLERESSNIKQYSDTSYFLYSRGAVPIEDEIFCQCKGLMFSAYKNGSIFATEYWINIFQEYFTEVYDCISHLRGSELVFNDIARFIKKNRPADDAIQEYDSLYDIYKDSSAYLILAEMMNVKISSDCDIIHYASKKYMMKKIQNSRDCIHEIEDIEDEKYKELSSIAQTYISEYAKKYPIPESWDNVRKRGYSSLRYAQKLQDRVLFSLGFGVGYVHCSFNVYEPSPEHLLTMAKFLTKYFWPDKEFSMEDIQLFAFILDTTASYCSSIERAYKMLDTILGFAPNFLEKDLEHHGSTFKEKLIPKENNEAVKPRLSKEDIVHRPVQNKEEEQTENQRLREELDLLRRDYHKLESSYEYLKYLYGSKESVENQLDTINQKYQDSQRELAEIRTHLYQMTEEDVAQEDLDYDSIKEELKKRNIIIIGGYSNWVSKVRELFPRWKFVDIKESSNKDTSIVEGSDKVYFFTDCLSHTTYYRYINTLRKNLIPFGYIHTVNIKSMIAQMAKELNINGK